MPPRPEELGALNHLLHHDGGGFGYLHHAVELCRQHLLGADVQRHTAHVALVDGPNDLGHYGIAALLGKGANVVFLSTHKLGHRGDAGCRQQLVNKIRGDITISVDAVDDTADARHINTVDDHILVGGSRRLHNLELLHFRASGADAGQDREYGLAALLNLLVQHIVDLENLHQSGGTEDNHDGIDVVHLFAGVDSQS